MLLTSCIRWCVGWVGFRAEGGLPARLLDDATANDLPIWGIRREGIVLKACCPARSYIALRRPARKAGMRLRITDKHGLPFLLHRFGSRWGLGMGAVAALLLLQLLSGRIWVITVNGNDTIPQAEILAIAEEWGVRIGAPIADLDIDTIRLHALTRMDGVAWLTVNPEGSVAHIELNESEPPLDIWDTTSPSNLIAARDGWILEMTILGGESMVKVGDAVTAGTLLVSGATIADKSLLLRRSFGSVIAQTERELSVNVPLQTEQLCPAGTRYRLFFSFFGLDIPLSGSATMPALHQLIQNDRFLTADGLTLPIGLRHRHYTIFEPHSVTLTPEEAYEEAVRRLRAREQVEFAQITVQESRYSCIQNTDSCVLTGQYICEENIAQEQPIYVEE